MSESITGAESYAVCIAGIPGGCFGGALGASSLVAIPLIKAPNPIAPPISSPNPGIASAISSSGPTSASALPIFSAVLLNDDSSSPPGFEIVGS